MKSYLRNFSTFRMLVLFLLVMAAGFYLYGRYQKSEAVVYDGVRYRKVYDSLLECADSFGKHLSIQETLGLALALQFASVDSLADSLKVGQTLEQALETAPAFIQGVGVFFPERGGAPRLFAYKAKDAGAADEEFNGQLMEDGGGSDEALPAVTESGRRLNWKMLAYPPDARQSRFSTLLSVDMASGGQAMIKADFSWVGGLLEHMRSVGGEHPMCLTPEGDALWLERGRLVFNRDYQPDDTFPGEEIVDRARLWSGDDLESDTGSDEFIIADILGAGWKLVVANPNLKTIPPASISIATFLLIIALSAMIFEVLISSLGHFIAAQSPGAMGGARAGESSRLRKILSHIHKVLFKYRIANPDQERIDSELRVARQIQFSLVPFSFPAYSEWREFDLYSSLSPAREVSGDYYDFFMLDPNRLVLAVGDVSGKGVPAALYMAVCRTAFRTLARRARNPGDLLTNLNDMLVRDSNSGLYVTIAAFFVDLPSGNCQYSLAGHPAPLFHEQSSNAAYFVDNPRETFIGMKAGLEFPVGEMRLNPGDSLLFYSDGVSEARNQKGDELGYDGLRKSFMDLVDSGSCRDLIEGLERSVYRFIDEREQEDDITLMAFRYWGPGGMKLYKRRGRISAKSGRRQDAGD